MSGPAKRERTATEPFATVISVLVTMLGLGMAVAVIATVWGSGSIFGLGNDEVCVQTGIVGLRMQSDSQLAGLAPGTRSFSNAYRLCTAHPDGGQRVLGVLVDAPLGLLYFSTLFLLYRLVRIAERRGPFSHAVARRARLVGWLLLAGSAGSAVATAIAQTALLGTLVDYDPGRSWTSVVDLPWGLLITGAGLLTVARVLRIGTAMRDEIDSTV